MFELNRNHPEGDNRQSFTPAEREVLSLLQADAAELSKPADADFAIRIAQSTAPSLHRSAMVDHIDASIQLGSWAWFGRLALAAAMGLAFIVGMTLLQDQGGVDNDHSSPRIADNVSDGGNPTNALPDDFLAGFQPVLISDSDDFFEAELAEAETILDTTEVTYVELMDELDAIQLALK